MANRAFDLAAAAAELQADPTADARRSPAEEDGDGDGDDGGAPLARQLQTPSPLSTPQPPPHPPHSLPNTAGANTAADRQPASIDTAVDATLVPQRPRTSTSTAEIGSTIARPGPVRINVKGAFIVDEEPSNGSNGNGSPTGSTRGERRSPRIGSGSGDSGNGSINGSVGGSTGGRAHSPSEHHATFDIRLPNHHAVVSHIAVDIGGTLAKVVYFSREAQSTEPGGRLNFQCFETDKIDDCIDFLLDLKQRHMDANYGARSSELCVMATGGGAYKYYDRIRARMGIDVLSEDEMECLIMGTPPPPPRTMPCHLICFC